jgi:hypothetical protein
MADAAGRDRYVRTASAAPESPLTSGNANIVKSKAYIIWDVNKVCWFDRAIDGCNSVQFLLGSPSSFNGPAQAPCRLRYALETHMEAHLANAQAESPDGLCPVNSHNEWDPLEEVIVGRLEGATMPSGHPVVTCNIPKGAATRIHSLVAGLYYPKIMVEPAQRELDGFIALLESLGIVVRRPEPIDHKKRFGTPYWSSRGFSNSCPRDAMLVVGDEIIETPMVWPCRYFETLSYRPVLKDYFRREARWTAAPKPQLPNELFDPNFDPPSKWWTPLISSFWSRKVF